MSEERQLTVAEILARAQQENPEAGARRRRRRSLEEGGVSVAELTGSLKKVEARPVEARHSSVPIDAPEEPKAAAPAASTSTRFVFPERVKPVTETPAAPERKPEVRPSEDETASIKKVVAPEPTRAAAPAAERPVETSVAQPVERTAPVQERAETEVFAAAQPSAVEAETLAPQPQPEPAYVHEGEGFDPFADDFDGEQSRVPADEIEVEEATVNPIVLVLLVFLGVILGVAGFLLFKWVWANTSTVVAALLGAAAVAAVVLGVGARRSGRDALTMTLAGLAAAVAAFGPALL